VGGEVERCQAPGERVVEVVDEPGLVAAAQDGVLETAGERAAESGPRRLENGVRLLFERDLCAGVADPEDADEEPCDRDERGADPDDRAWRIAGGECPGRERRDRDAKVAGGFVESKRETPPRWTGEVDLHHDRH